MMIQERWQKIRDVIRGGVRFVRPWVDPSSNRPLVLLVVVSFGVFLSPLFYNVGRLLINWLPRWVPWSVGEAALLSLVAVGLWRLWRVRPTDSWPMPASPDEPANDTAAARYVPWALRLAVASLILPIMQNPDGLPFADWDFVSDKFEALRRSIIIWGQFPWWNPWCRGGFPLAAEPQIGAVSMATPLVLILGTSIGLRLSAILCIWIAIEGAYRLAWLWLREPWSSAAVALIYGLNGGVAVDTAQGYVLAMSYCSVPWLAYHAFRIGERFSDGIWLGFWLAFVVMNGIQYLSLYGGVLTTLIWIRALRMQPPARRAQLLTNTIAAVGTFLALCSWRLVPVLLVMRDDQREQVTHWDESPLAVLDYLLNRPIPDWPTVIPGRHWADFVELTGYVGPMVVLLGLVSLAHGWRWWHTLMLICAWLALGSMRWYHPSLWLSIWPFFSTAHVVTRWRFLALLGLGLAAGSVLARMQRSGRKAGAALAALLTVGIAVDYVVLAHQQLPWAFAVRPEPNRFPGLPVPEIVNVREGLGYACVVRGYGVIQGYEPMLGYRRDAPTLRRAREDRDYRGEFWTAIGEIHPSFWSPNRVVFRVEPGQEVWINQNPGSWWRVNGRPAYPGRRCAEPMIPFVAKADDNGRLELEIHPPGLEVGIGLHVVGVALLAAAWLGRRYRIDGTI